MKPIHMIEKAKQKTYDILRWSEKYTKTDMIYLTQGGSWIILGQVISALSGFGLAIVFANFLPQETYGTYKYILSLAGIIGIFSLSGLGTAVARSVAQGLDGTLLFAFKKKLTWSLITISVALSFAAYYFIQEDFALSTAMLIIAALTPIINSAGLFVSFLQGKQNFKATTFSSAVYSVVSALVVIGAVFVSDNPIVIVFANLASQALIYLFFFFKTKRKYHIKKTIEDHTMWMYGKHSSVTNILSTIAGRIDSILIFHYLGSAELALYGFAVMIPEQLLGITRSVSTLAIPKFVQRAKEEVQKMLPHKMLRFFAVSLALFVIYYFLSPYIYELFFPAYIDAIEPSRFFALILLLPIILPNSFLESQAAIKERYITSSINNGLRIILMWVLVIPYGVWGILVARVATRVIAFFVTTILAKRL